MTFFGRILEYDPVADRGEIAPDLGGIQLKFTQAAMQDASDKPEVGQRYAFDLNSTKGELKVAKLRLVSATNLSLKEQAQLQRG